jgi:hypothetical protein
MANVDLKNLVRRVAHFSLQTSERGGLASPFGHNRIGCPALRVFRRVGITEDSCRFSAHRIDQDLWAVNTINQFVYIVRRSYYGHIGDCYNPPGWGMLAENS